MHRSYGRLMLLALVICTAYLLLMPMHTTESFGIEHQRLSMIEGETRMIGYTDKNGALTDARYSVDHKEIVTVSADGRVTARSAGTAAVTVSEGSMDVAVLTVNVRARSGKVTLSAEQLDLNKGEVSALQASVAGEDKSLVWTSSNPNIVSVDNDGRVIAANAGTADVTATSASGYSATTHVSVHVAASGVSLEPRSILVGKGAQISVSPVFNPADATDTQGTWVSENPAVVTVQSDGVVKAVGAGHAVVHFTTDKGLTAQTEVTVEEGTAVLIPLDKNVRMNRGDTAALNVGQDTTDHLVQWFSSVPAVASVEDGIVTAHASGKTQISATLDGQTTTATLTVVTPVRNITLNVTELYLLREQTNEPIRLTATIAPTDADENELTFSTDNALVAYAAQDGTVTLTGAYGSAVITVSAPGGAFATCTINVVTELPETQSAAPTE